MTREYRSRRGISHGRCDHHLLPLIKLVGCPREWVRRRHYWHPVWSRRQQLDRGRPRWAEQVHVYPRM